VEDPSLSNSLDQFGWVLEDISPGHDGAHIVIHTFAARDGVWEHPDDVTEVLDTLDEVQSFKVSHSFLGVISKRLDVFHACAELFKMVITSKSINQTGHEVWDQVERWKVCGVSTLDGANCDSHKGSEVVTSLEEKSSVKVGLQSFDVTLDLSLVESVMLGEGLAELGWVCEDLGP